MKNFEISSKFSPSEDQARAAQNIVASVKSGNKYQTLLGVTGSGKTFTMANIIAQHGVPTLVLAHNKTLAAQLYREAITIGAEKPPVRPLVYARVEKDKVVRY